MVRLCKVRLGCYKLIICGLIMTLCQIALLKSKPGGLDWSRHWQKVSLDSQENLDNFKKLVSTIEKSWFFLDTTFQSQKSGSRSRNLSRPEIFGKSWQFVSISIKSESILSYFLIEISQFVKIFEPAVTQKVSKMLRYLDKSQKVSMKILTQLNLNWKVSILKILTEKKNNLVSTVRIILTSFKSWSRQIKKSQSRLVSTVKTLRLIEIPKDDQEIDGKITSSKMTIVLWRDTCGITYEPLSLLGSLGSVRVWKNRLTGG